MARAPTNLLHYLRHVTGVWRDDPRRGPRTRGHATTADQSMADKLARRALCGWAPYGARAVLWVAWRVACPDCRRLVLGRPRARDTPAAS